MIPDSLVTAREERESRNHPGTRAMLEAVSGFLDDAGLRLTTDQFVALAGVIYRATPSAPSLEPDLEDTREAVVAELVGVESAIESAMERVEKAMVTLAGGLNRAAVRRLAAAPDDAGQPDSLATPPTAVEPEPGCRDLTYDAHDWNSNGSPSFCRDCGISFPKFAALAASSGPGEWEPGIGSAQIKVDSDAQEARRHVHGDQPCDPSEATAIAQMLRDEGPLRHVSPDSEHIAEWNCWCHPTAERQPNGAYLFIHREEVV